MVVGDNIVCNVIGTHGSCLQVHMSMGASGAQVTHGLPMLYTRHSRTISTLHMVWPRWKSEDL